MFITYKIVLKLLKYLNNNYYYLYDETSMKKVLWGTKKIC